MPAAAPADLAHARSLWPETQLEQLQAGRKLYQSRCGGCHRLYAPGELPAGRWQEEVTEMAERSHLNAEQSDAVLKYLVALSQRKGALQASTSQ